MALACLLVVLAMSAAGCAASDSGEESGAQYRLDQTYDEIRAGARLILSYEAASNSFVGTVENTTSETLDNVRVEVHLSNGVELGPTPAMTVPAAETIEVILEATDEPFDTFSAHPEVGQTGEGGEHDNESDGEHGKEGEGEHSG